jgi:hypothetical protein
MSEKTEKTLKTTPLPIIANVSRVVTRVVDRVTGDRVDYPLLVAAACVEALKKFDIQARIMYGQVAWIEVMENFQVAWAGCWGQNFHFWVETEFVEVVDLNTSVAFRKRSHSTPHLKALYSPPILWSVEIPKFYRFVPEGIAELELTDDKDQKRFETVLREISEKCGPQHLGTSSDQLDFPNEPLLCPGRQLLDDSQQTFKHFDRALAVHGIPKAPI